MNTKLPLRRKENSREDLLDEYEAAEILGLSVHWLRRSRLKKPAWAGPKFIQPDGYHVKYSRRHLEEFLATRNGGPRVVNPADRLAAAS